MKIMTKANYEQKKEAAQKNVEVKTAKVDEFEVGTNERILALKEMVNAYWDLMSYVIAKRFGKYYIVRKLKRT